MKGKAQLLINWLPEKDSVFEKIDAGDYDEYLKESARLFSQYDKTIFLNFAPEVGNPDQSYSLPTGEHAFVYQNAWKHVFEFMANQGISNLVWIWTPYSLESINYFYPGAEYVDWVGIPFSGTANKENFIENYEGFRQIFSPFPTLIFDKNEGESSWIAGNGFSQIVQDSFPEIQGWVMDYQGSDNFQSEWDAISLKLNQGKLFSSPPFIPSSEKTITFASNAKTGLVIEPVKNIQSASDWVILQAENGDHFLQLNGKPFYIKGITYNPGHDWRDAHSPLVRKQLEIDFKRISEMGGNVIRRYKPTIYDYNILSIARENDLKVLFGFYFDPKVDYYADTAKVKSIKQEVLKEVRSYQGNSTVLAWGLGNETWGLLKHHYRPSYLPRVRRAYLDMVEDIATEIQKIDSEHLIFSALEHSEDLQVGLSSFRQRVPSLDFISINSYYTERISSLDSIANYFYPNKPYLVSEFGPSGYWVPEYTPTDARGQLMEASSYQKAKEYIDNWENYIAPNNGKNLGGVAFCWRDRFEGTATWFGITDISNRIKPGYYALKEAWTGEKEPFPIADAYIIPPWEVSTYRLSKVVTKDFKRRDLHYEWYICRETMLERVGDIDLQDLDRSALIDLPEEASEYRIYVHISDEEGHVVTASTPVVKRENN